MSLKRASVYLITGPSTAFQRALIKAELETGLVKSNFLQHCPFSEDNILDPNFWPMPAHDGSDTLVKVKN